jgi:CHRD domain
MKLLKLTVLPISLFALLLSFSSCEPNAEQKRVTDYEKKGIVMSGAQEVPANASTAIGTLDVAYTRNTRTLTYTFRWSGLSGPVTVFHIHGLAPVGYTAPVVQTFNAANIVRCNAASTTACGSYSGSFQVDGVVVKEEDLLNGMYYVNIHSAAFPGGEIKGQIRFQ